MKKLTVLIGFLLCLTACGSSEVVREARKTMNGNWTLTSVDYPGNTSNVEVALLSDASSECFRNSQWDFISNNNTGTYVLDGEDCGEQPRFFNWGIEDDKGEPYSLTLKPTDSRKNSTAQNHGFRLNLVNLSQNQMIWEQTVQFEGSPFTIRMNFIKN